MLVTEKNYGRSHVKGNIYDRYVTTRIRTGCLRLKFETVLLDSVAPEFEELQKYINFSL